MVLKRLIGVVFAGALAFSAAAADVIVRIAPPHIVVENRGPRPSRTHVWVSGYHRWDGHAYVWTAGRWSSLHGPAPTGSPIAGCTGAADTSW